MGAKRNWAGLVILVIMGLLLAACVISQHGGRLVVLTEGEGTVVLPGEGIHNYQGGVVVDLQAEPASGWIFKEWIGPVQDATASATKIQVVGTKTVVAVFEQLGLPMGQQVAVDSDEPMVFDGGLILDFSLVDLPSDLLVTVTDVSDSVSLPQGLTLLGPVIQVTFSDGDVDFSAGVRLAFSLPESPVVPIGIFHANNGEWDYQPSTIEDGMIFAFVEHFSIYTYLGAVRASAPTAEPSEASLHPGTFISLSTTTAGADVYYRTDADQDFALYQSGLFMPDHDLTIYAFARKANKMNSIVQQFTYTVAAWPTLATIPEIADVQVPFNTSYEYALGSLPFMAFVTDSADVDHMVYLHWSIEGYAGNVTASYLATGEFELPFGVSQTDPPLPLHVEAYVIVEPQVYPYIQSVSSVKQVQVPYGTLEAEAKAELQQETSILDSEWNNHAVSLEWFIWGYDAFRPDEYPASASFALPQGVTQSYPETPLFVSSTVTVLPQVFPWISSIEPSFDLSVPYGTDADAAKAQLSSVTSIHDSTGGKHLVSLQWSIDQYDGQVAAAYTATGTFSLPDGVVQSDPPMELSVTVTLTVLDPVLPHITAIDPVSNLLVNYNSRRMDVLAMLASVTTIADSEGVVHHVNLDWELAAYEPSQAGNYEAVGSFSLPDGVIQSDPAMPLEVRPVVTVKEAYPRWQASVPDGGTFTMGLAPAGTLPTGVNSGGTAIVDEEFWIGETVVTYNLWYAVREWAIQHGFIFDWVGQEASGGQPAAPPSANGSFMPAVGMSWYDVIIWCNALSARSGLEPVYYQGGEVAKNANLLAHNAIVAEPTDGFRLPTRDEWELAARYQGVNSFPISIERPYGSGTFWTLGNYASGAWANVQNPEANAEVAWYSANAGVVQGVGLRRPNALGLYDMSGNVSEWCFTAYSSVARVIRGGSVGNDHHPLQIGWYTHMAPDRAAGNLGFRLARRVAKD